MATLIVPQGTGAVTGVPVVEVVMFELAVVVAVSGVAAVVVCKILVVVAVVVCWPELHPVKAKTTVMKNSNKDLTNPIN